MRPIREKRSKKHFFILLNGDRVGESWAVSAEKAINNYWWRDVKGESKFSPREYNPSEFDAVEM